MLPAVSSSAFLQSIIPAPVRERSSATSLALIGAVIVSDLLIVETPPAEGAGGVKEI
jgi:hypothetical protein